MSLSNCTSLPKPIPVPVDSYCLEYNKVIQEKGDGAIVAAPGVKKRLLANELNYARCQAPKKVSAKPSAKEMLKQAFLAKHFRELGQ